jgi:hypothetical protein
VRTQVARKCLKTNGRNFMRGVSAGDARLQACGSQHDAVRE